MRVLDALRNLHWDELSLEEKVARQEAEGLKLRAASMLAGMQEELTGQVARLQRAEAEKIRLATVDTQGFNGSQRIEHATAVAYADEEVITLTARAAHIEQQIRKCS